jgi:hypothetical protein
MRVASVLALVLLLVPAPGCFVVEEIDSGMKVWKHHSPKKKQAETPPEELAGAPSGARAKLEDWWQSARSLGSDELSADIVSCEIGGSTQFMREADCLSQGGRTR